MIFIVSVRHCPASCEPGANRTQESSADMSYQLSHQLHRSGHHVRGNIVEEARALIADMPDAEFSGKPEPIPATQDQYTRQVSDAIRDLFPNIPNTDRELIIIHGFNLVGTGPRLKSG